jgi:hypothetical protein
MEGALAQTAGNTSTSGHSLPFRRILPLAQLVISMLAVWPIWLRLVLALGVLIQPNAPALPQKPINIMIPSASEPRRLTFTEIRLITPAALNVPVQIVQIPYAIFSSTKSEWIPSISWLPPVFQFSEIWRAMTWPFAGIPFWWVVGRSFEALAAHKRAATPKIHWVELLFGLVMVAFGILMFAVFVSDSTFPSLLLFTSLAGGILWAVLGSVILAAYVLQRRKRQVRAT